MLQKIKPSYILIAILVLAFFTRIYNIDYPKAYVFDEVYHAFTATQYLDKSAASWEWFSTPPKGVAYEWTHPPMAKEIMAFSMLVLNNRDYWPWRVPGVLFALVSIYTLYLIGKKLFSSEEVGLLSAFLFSLDGLTFVQSRTGMNDIYFITFSLLSLYFLLSKKYIFTAIFLGFAIATKWTALYLFAMEGLICLDLFVRKQISFKKGFLIFLALTLIPGLIYLISYIPFFQTGHSFAQFIELQRQMWFYHTGLVATHDYASAWWTWPLNLFPVWYYVQYFPDKTISNIFGTGNPLLYWIGIGMILLSLIDFVRTKSYGLKIGLLGFFIFWLPWALSPRIMFLYHYAPSVPFLCLLFAYQLSLILNTRKTRYVGFFILGLVILGFIFVYPVLVGIPLEKKILDLFFQTNFSKNPFPI